VPLSSIPEYWLQGAFLTTFKPAQPLVGRGWSTREQKLEYKPFTISLSRRKWFIPNNKRLCCGFVAEHPRSQNGRIDDLEVVISVDTASPSSLVLARWRHATHFFGSKEAAASRLGSSFSEQSETSTLTAKLLFRTVPGPSLGSLLKDMWAASSGVYILLGFLRVIRTSSDTTAARLCFTTRQQNILLLLLLLLKRPNLGHKLPVFRIQTVVSADWGKRFFFYFSRALRKYNQSSWIRQCSWEALNYFAEEARRTRCDRSAHYLAVKVILRGAFGMW